MADDCLKMEHTTPQEFQWSWGKNIHDNKPKSYSGSWSDFCQFLDEHRTARKGLDYFSSVFGGDKRRSDANALPRLWMPFDVDCAMTDYQAKELVGLFSLFKCLFYETASSKPGARRLRFVAQLSRPVSDFEAKRIGEVFEGFWQVGKFDSSVCTAAQPIYLPPTDAKILRFSGRVIDPDFLFGFLRFKKAKLEKTIAYKNTETPDAYEFFSQNGLIKCSTGSALKVRCPWVDEHSTSNEDGTAYFEPSVENNFVGGFICHHHHCDGRTIKDVFELMKRGGKWD